VIERTGDCGFDGVGGGLNRPRIPRAIGHRALGTFRASTSSHCGCLAIKLDHGPGRTRSLPKLSLQGDAKAGPRVVDDGVEMGRGRPSQPIGQAQQGGSGTSVC